MKVAYIFATQRHNVSYVLAKMILPQLEENRHGADVVGMLGLALRGGQRIGVDRAGIASHSLFLRHRRRAANRVGMPVYFPFRPG